MKKFVMFGIRVLLLWVIFYEFTFGQNMTGEDILRTMKSIDATFTSEMTLVMDAETPASVLRSDDMGYVKSHLTLTSKNGSWGIERKFGPDFNLPTYRKMTPQTRNDFDLENNLLVTRKLQNEDLQEPDFRGKYWEVGMFRISPDGTVSKDTKNMQIIELHPSPLDTKEGERYYHFGEFRWLLWSAGRGFSECLNEITEVTKDPSGLLHLRANGWNGVAESQGTWILVIDPQAAYMVRSAAFTSTGQTSPETTCETIGTKWFENACIPERGKVVLVGLPERRFVFVNYTPQGDVELLGRLRNRLRGIYPDGIMVRDYRAGSESPLIYIIGEIPGF